MKLRFIDFLNEMMIYRYFFIFLYSDLEGLKQEHSVPCGHYGVKYFQRSAVISMRCANSITTRGQASLDHRYD